jgi:hypothetical protein
MAKGVLFPDMARTMLQLIVQALAIRGVPATIAYYDPAAWSGAVVYTTRTDEYHNDLMHRIANQQREHERGIARGVRSAVLDVLGERGVTVPEAVRERLSACTDLGQLSVWLRRAATATTAAETFD